MTTAQIIDGIIEREGGIVYSNRAADKGGPTKAGITAATLGAWRKLGRAATEAEVQALEEPEIRAIYTHEYVVEPGFDQIADERLRVLVVDCGVLHGQSRAARWLQEALDVPVDGVLGPHTLGAAKARPAAAVSGIIRIRCDFMMHLALDSPAMQAFKKAHPKEQVHNLRGWIRRAIEFAA